VLTIVLTMLIILLVSAAVVVYVAYPHRGEDVPKAPWLGEMMHKTAEALPTLHEEDSLR
jgi:hypothetical protein